MKQEGLFDAEDNDDCDSVAHANMESNPSDAAFRANETPRFTAPCYVHFHHTRKRLADLDGLSIKAVLDQLVHAGILADDSPQRVAQITHSQSKGDQESTTITITEIDSKTGK